MFYFTLKHGLTVMLTRWHRANFTLCSALSACEVRWRMWRHDDVWGVTVCQSADVSSFSSAHYHNMTQCRMTLTVSRGSHTDTHTAPIGWRLQFTAICEMKFRAHVFVFLDVSGISYDQWRRLIDWYAFHGSDTVFCCRLSSFNFSLDFWYSYFTKTHATNVREDNTVKIIQCNHNYIYKLQPKETPVDLMNV